MSWVVLIILVVQVILAVVVCPRPLVDCSSKFSRRF